MSVEEGQKTFISEMGLGFVLWRGFLFFIMEVKDNSEKIKKCITAVL